MNIKRAVITVCGIAAVLFFGFVSAPRALAAENTNGTSDADKYKLDEEVKEWLDAGNSIPGEVKYSTLAATGHLWELDDTDISDGKVILKAGEETRELYGFGLKNWIKTQFFYGDQFGADDNRKKFIRPKKTDAF
ncbi:MAG: hypothetical protein J5966_08720 [Lachnospiraceae bacterium]|nr:hypothetical protein [Lachnospiraceae bacterium]